MLKFGFIGLGQVGGAFVEEAKSFDNKVIAINTAQVDLNVLNELEKDEKIHLINYEGAGKDRTIGKEAFLAHQEMIMDRISEKFKDCNVLFPVAALGGGTGSGMIGEITNALTKKFHNKIISPIMFLPDMQENYRAKINTLEAFTEISSNEDIGATFILDNRKILELNQSFTLKEKYRYTRNEFLSILHAFNERTDVESELANLDKMDLLTILSERGNCMICDIEIDEQDTSDAKKMGKRLLNAFNHSPFAKTNLSNILKAALIIDLPTEATTNLAIDSIFSEIGMPLEVFSGICESKEKFKLLSMISGLPFPFGVLKEIEEDVKKNQKRIININEETRSQQFQSDTSWTDSLKRKKRVEV